MIKQADIAAIAALDLGRIKTKLCHVESGEGWSLARADAAEVEYRRFLQLMKAFPTEQVVPSVEVDTFWHYHILDTVKYAADCEAAFGYFVHHDPSVGIANAVEAADRTQRIARMATLYSAIFGKTPAPAKVANYAARSNVSYCGANNPKAAWCGSAVQATDSAWCGWVAPTSVSASALPVVAMPATESAWCGWSPTNAGVDASAPATESAWCGWSPTNAGADASAPATESAWCGWSPTNASTEAVAA